MKRLAFLLGPELLWIAFFLLASWLAGRNSPPSVAGDASLERVCLIGPFLFVALTFLTFLVPGPSRMWLLVRIALAAVIGVNACLFKLIDGIDYGDSRNSGVLGLWVYGVLTGGLALVPGAITALVFLLRTAPK